MTIKVVPVVIGPDWLTTLSEEAAQPSIDYVRAEVTRALACDFASSSERVLPVLIGGTSMPTTLLSALEKLP